MIVRLHGGLANTMFQAAFGFSLAKKRNEPLFFDVSSFKTDKLWTYQLEQYGLDMMYRIVEDDIPRYAERSLLYDPEALRQPPGTFFDGYWQSEQYWDDPELVKNLFAVPKGWPNERCRTVARRISATESCFIGVRRGDYLWPERIAYHGVMGMEYYQKAIELIPPQARNFYVFTDDVPWVRENFTSFGYTLVDVNGPGEKAWDIWLMRLCKNAIIANSTFHWMGAWLGADSKGGTIVAPAKWFANGLANEIVPHRWKRI